MLANTQKTALVNIAIGLCCIKILGFDAKDLLTIFFITQNPADIPDSVLAQLGNKIQHALRAYTPSEQKAVRAAAQSFPINPAFKTEDVIPVLGKGEALVSFLDEKGIPGMVQRAYILPPQSQMGIADDGIVGSMILQSDMYPKYSQMVDRESAYELLNGIMPAGVTLQYAQAPAGSFYAPNMQPNPNAGGSWICPFCGMSNAGNFCGNCGQARPVQQAAPSPFMAEAPQAPSITNYQESSGQNLTEQFIQQNYGQTPAQAPIQQSFAQPPQYSSYQQYAQMGSYNGPSLVASVQAQQMAQAAQTQTFTQAQLDKMQKEAVKQAKAELKAEQAANKESDLSKSAKSIATSGARTAVNYLVRGALGTLLKKK